MAIDDAKLWRLVLFGEEIKLLYNDSRVTLGRNDDRLLALLACWHDIKWDNEALYRALFPPRQYEATDHGDTIRNKKVRLCRALLKQVDQESVLNRRGTRIDGILKPLLEKIEVDVAIFDWEFDEWQKCSTDESKQSSAVSHCKNVVSYCDGILLGTWQVDSATDQVSSWLLKERARRLEDYHVAFSWLIGRDPEFCMLKLNDAVHRGLLPDGVGQELEAQRSKRLLALVASLPPPSIVLEQDAATIQNKIDDYVKWVNEGQYDVAWQYFQEKLNYVLDFTHSQNFKHLQLLLMLFPDGPDESPRLASPIDRIESVHALARAYKNLGQPGKAVQIYQSHPVQQIASGLQLVPKLANTANSLRLIGQLREAESESERMLDEASRLNEFYWQAYSLYWNGVLRVGRGRLDDGVLFLRQAQVIFEACPDHHRYKRQCVAGTGRTYAHLAQVELWQDNASMALSLASRAAQLAAKGSEHREVIFSARLIGMANLLLNKFDDSRSSFERALNDARLCGYFEEELATTIGLAELDRRAGNRRSALRWLDDAMRARAEKGPYALLLTDFFNTLSRIHDDEGNRQDAVESGIQAYRTAWCDGPPFHYHWGLQQAEKCLVKLGAPLPAVTIPKRRRADSQLRRTSPSSISALDESELVRADLRAQFTKFLRTITGNYRYAPTKFLRMLREDWDVIRDIVTGKEAIAKPQFLEVHVGHPCNLHCDFCRGELRNIPQKQVFLQKERILSLIDEVYELNPNSFVRFSGVIGEPLLHPDIVEVFKATGRKDGLGWGITTNGIRLDQERRNALLGLSDQERQHTPAQYVHISLDAGTDVTYRRLKKGHPGDFEKVMENIVLLVEARERSQQEPKVIVSFLLQELNYEELPILAKRLKDVGVDSLEVKMQHFDPVRIMSPEDVGKAYDLIWQVQRDFSNPVFRVVVVQTREEALAKIHEGGRRITFSSCYANMLGLNPTVDPTGEVQTCCQYYQRTLGPVGNIAEQGFKTIWTGALRQESLARDPSIQCVNCSPSDEFVNRFVHFLKDAHRRDSSFLNWVAHEVTLIREMDQGN